MFALLRRHGAENHIPERRGNAIGFIRVFVMMLCVMRPQLVEQRRGRLCVDRIVDVGIHEVAVADAGHECKGIPAEEQEPAPEHHEGNDSARYRRHEQPLMVARVLMVNAMHNVMETLQERQVFIDVENKAVQHILHEGPGNNAGNIKAGGFIQVQPRVAIA